MYLLWNKTLRLYSIWASQLFWQSSNASSYMLHFTTVTVKWSISHDFKKIQIRVQTLLVIFIITVTIDMRKGNMISIFHIFEISINIENTFKKYSLFPVFKKKFSFNYRISRFFLSFRRLSFLITSPLERNFCAFSQMNFPLLILYVGYVSLLLKATNV